MANGSGSSECRDEIGNGPGIRRESVGNAHRFRNHSLAPGKKIANAIHEVIPQVRGVNGGFVYVRSTDVPLYAIELFYTEDLKVLSNIAAGRLLKGMVYAPPE
jgi:hypothetical protein